MTDIYPAARIPVRITVTEEDGGEPMLSTDVTVLAGNDLHAEAIGHQLAAVLLTGWAHTGVVVGGRRQVSVVTWPDRANAS